MRRSCFFVIAVALIAILSTHCTANIEPLRATKCRASEEQGHGDEILRSFLYDAASRFNESLLATIDAADTALIAVLACDVAIVVFMMDKIAVLQPVIGVATLTLLGASVLACTGGYVAGLRLRLTRADGVRPRMFIPDVALRSGEAIIGALEQLIAASEANLTLRMVKRLSAMAAIVFLLAAMVCLSAVRWSGGVVH